MWKHSLIPSGLLAFPTFKRVWWLYYNWLLVCVMATWENLLHLAEKEWRQYTCLLLFLLLLLCDDYQGKSMALSKEGRETVWLHLLLLLLLLSVVLSFNHTREIGSSNPCRWSEGHCLNRTMSRWEKVTSTA